MANPEPPPEIYDELRKRLEVKDKEGAIDLYYKLLSSGRTVAEIIAQPFPGAAGHKEDELKPDLIPSSAAEAVLESPSAPAASEDRKDPEHQSGAVSIRSVTEDTVGIEDSAEVSEVSPAPAAPELAGPRMRKARLAFLMGALAGAVGVFGLYIVDPNLVRHLVPNPSQDAKPASDSTAIAAALVSAEQSNTAQRSQDRPISTEAAAKAPAPTAAFGSPGWQFSPAADPAPSVARAPAPPSLVALPSSASANASLAMNQEISNPQATKSEANIPIVDADELVARGDAALAISDVTAARLFYQRAAEAGDNVAALRLGQTFDPAFLERAHFGRSMGDRQQAASWYGRARDLGNRDAALLLKYVESIRQ